MIVSWNWLKDYVDLDVSPEELQRRLMLAGLNHEATHSVGDDLAIDLEVTSNRPDCLGHLGVAREVAVLLGRPLRIPLAEPRQSAPPANQLTRVALECPQLCWRYTARVVQGVRVGPSPKWLTDRLATLGIAAINNVVDITNYVLMECGQPLHAFDLTKLAGRQIIVRDARPGEPFLAINHKTYTLEPGMCVIADRNGAVGLGGVMGGAETEVSAETTELLIEAAEFDPQAIRSTARRLNLHSDSSYRFERGLDPEGVDWASRRCCELILELAGGTLAEGVIDVGRRPPPREPIVLRLARIKRILGIEISAAEARRILQALGNRLLRADDGVVEVIPPSWRRDLTREVDLIEEVGRIHGYDAIPEDVSVPMAPSTRTHRDRVFSRVRETLTAAGYDEALTVSAVDEGASEAFSPWTDAAALRSLTPVLRRADRLRRSLIPSLLLARQTNESLANARIELFEIAKVYLPRAGALPDEQWMLGLTSGGGFFDVKGVIETVVAQLNPALTLEVADFAHPLLSADHAVELRLAGDRLGLLGEVSEAGLKQFDLRRPTTVAELRLDVIEQRAEMVRRAGKLSPFPAVTRDLNLVVDEAVRWADLADTATTAAGPLLESLAYRDTYRDPQRLGRGKKSVLLTLTLRPADATLTSSEADAVRDAVVEACARLHGAQLRT